jgi:hypothetical protein
MQRNEVAGRLLVPPNYVSIYTSPLLLLQPYLGRVLDTLDDFLRLTEERRMRTDRRKGHRIGTKRLREVLLNRQEQCLISLAVQIRAQHIMPRLVQDLVGEDTRRLVFLLGDGSLLTFVIEVMAENLLRSCGIAVITLSRLLASFLSLQDISTTYIEFHPRQALPEQVLHDCGR